MRIVALKFAGTRQEWVQRVRDNPNEIDEYKREVNADWLGRVEQDRQSPGCIGTAKYTIRAEGLRDNIPIEGNSTTWGYGDLFRRVDGLNALLFDVAERNGKQFILGRAFARYDQNYQALTAKRDLHDIKCGNHRISCHWADQDMADPRATQRYKNGPEDLGWVRVSRDGSINISNEKMRSLMPIPSGFDYKFKYQVEPGKICSSCGEPGHWRNECTKRDQLTCEHCVRNGRLATAHGDHIGNWCFIEFPHLNYKKRGNDV